MKGLHRCHQQRPQRAEPRVCSEAPKAALLMAALLAGGPETHSWGKHLRVALTSLSVTADVSGAAQTPASAEGSCFFVMFRAASRKDRHRFC